LEEHTFYAVAPGIRARKESFGLLFYNTENARLTFVRSRELLLLAGDPVHGSILSAQARCQAEAARARRILDALRKKGLIRERPCTGAQ
jgi:putative mycofactocin binding protein MftB